jgi:hypothetical protein
VASHGGHIVKTTGDGLLMEFPSIVAAGLGGIGPPQGAVIGPVICESHSRAAERVVSDRASRGMLDGRLVWPVGHGKQERTWERGYVAE